MKAVFIEQYGGPEVLKYGDLPDPVAASDDVVVDVFGASVNGVDWKVRAGQCKQPKFPFAYFTQVVTGCDAVFDTVGGDVAQRSFAVVKPGGRAAFIASGQAPKSNRSDATSLRPPVGRARRHLKRIAHLFQAGAIRPPEIKLYRLSEADDTHRLSESRHFRGKLVFRVR
jgi:NADPH:quinone reductase-like Zn-dependent oxidoreductase